MLDITQVKKLYNPASVTNQRYNTMNQCKRASFKSRWIIHLWKNTLRPARRSLVYLFSTIVSWQCNWMGTDVKRLVFDYTARYDDVPLLNYSALVRYKIVPISMYHFTPASIEKLPWMTNGEEFILSNKICIQSRSLPEIYLMFICISMKLLVNILNDATWFHMYSYL